MVWPDVIIISFSHFLHLLNHQLDLKTFCEASCRVILRFRILKSFHSKVQDSHHGAIEILQTSSPVELYVSLFWNLMGDTMEIQISI